MRHCSASSASRVEVTLPHLAGNWGRSQRQGSVVWTHTIIKIWISGQHWSKRHPASGGGGELTCQRQSHPNKGHTWYKGGILLEHGRHLAHSGHSPGARGHPFGSWETCRKYWPGAQTTPTRLSLSLSCPAALLWDTFIRPMVRLTTKHPSFEEKSDLPSPGTPGKKLVTGRSRLAYTPLSQALGSRRTWNLASSQRLPVSWTRLYSFDPGLCWVAPFISLHLSKGTLLPKRTPELLSTVTPEEKAIFQTGFYFYGRLSESH